LQGASESKQLWKLKHLAALHIQRRRR
jgi:hypothetical protein